MPAVAKVPLGAATLMRKWYLDVNDGSHDVPDWVGVFGMTDFKPAVEPVMKDDSDLDSSGWKSESPTALAWSLDFKLERKVVDGAPTTYNPGQEILRLASVALGVGNHVEVRWYEMTDGGPKVEAYMGYAAVQWKPAGGSMEDHDTVDVTLSGQGIRTPITHPDGAAVVPVLTRVSPAVGIQAGGTIHTLHGSGFFAAGVDDVKSMLLGSTNVPTFVAVSDNELVFVAPPKAAAQFIVYVTNTVGKSITTSVVLDIS